MSGQIEVVPATLEDVQQFYKGLPPYRLRAYAGKLNGETLGLGGLYYLPDKAQVGFLILTEKGRRYPRALYKATFEFLDRLRSEGVQHIHAVADPEIEKAESFLLRIGFTKLETRDGQVVYEWLAPAQP